MGGHSPNHLNSRPADYKSAALPAELWRRMIISQLLRQKLREQFLERGGIWLQIPLNPSKQSLRGEQESLIPVNRQFSERKLERIGKRSFPMNYQLSYGGACMNAFIS